MYNWLTETYHAVTVSYVRKPRTVRIGDFDGFHTGHRTYAFRTIDDAESFLRACGYSREAGCTENFMNASLGGKPAVEKITTWIWSGFVSEKAHLDERTVVPVKKEHETIKIQVQFYNHPVFSYTVKELGSDRELDVYTDSLRTAIEQFLGKYYSQHDRILVDKLNGNTFAIHLKKPAHA